MVVKIRLLFIVIFPILGFSQEITQGEFSRRLDLGEDLMKKGEYELAQSEFLFILENQKVLPPNLAYLFGRNSYHLSQYKQSINWLNKYIQIKGTKGPYHDEAVKFLNLSEDKYLEIQRSRTAEMTEKLANQRYDCGGLEKMICPVCKGNGVIISQGAFGESYKTCPYSGGESYLSCGDYNDFMSGLLEPKFTN